MKSLERNASLAIKGNLVSGSARVNLAVTRDTGNVPRVGNLGAVLAFASSGATAACPQVLERINTIIVRGAAKGFSAIDRASREAGRAQRVVALGVTTLVLVATVTITTLASPITSLASSITSLASSITALTPSITSLASSITALTPAIATLAPTIATLARSLGGMSRNTSCMRGILLAAPGSLGPTVALPTSRLRRIRVTRDTASLVVVPVPGVLGAVAGARRSRRFWRATVFQAAAAFTVPELVALAAGTGLEGRLSGNQADNSCGEGNNTSK